MTYLLLKWIHVLAAITGLGANVTYGIWITRATRRPEVLPFTLRGIKLIDDRVANPAYGVLLITGLLMVFFVRIPLDTPWLLSSIVLYTLVILVALLGYAPVLRGQIQMLGRAGVNSPAYQALARRGTILGATLGVLTIIIVFLMVVKPSLWA